MELVSLVLGGLLRLLPEAMGYFGKAQDNKQELAMMDKQMAMDAQKSEQTLTHAQLTGDYANALAQLSAHASALSGQMQKTGTAWLDALTFSVRPVVTYYFLLMYGLAKCAQFAIAADVPDADLWATVMAVYDDKDREALWGILGFWFVSRTLEKPSISQHVITPGLY